MRAQNNFCMYFKLRCLSKFGKKRIFILKNCTQNTEQNKTKRSCQNSDIQIKSHCQIGQLWYFAAMKLKTKGYPGFPKVLSSNFHLKIAVEVVLNGNYKNFSQFPWEESTLIELDNTLPILETLVAESGHSSKIQALPFLACPPTDRQLPHII